MSVLDDHEALNLHLMPMFSANAGSSMYFMYSKAGSKDVEVGVGG